MDEYYASEVDPDALMITSVRHPNVTHIGDVTSLDAPALSKLGPIDLLIGGSPCNEFSIVNPARKGFDSKNG